MLAFIGNLSFLEMGMILVIAVLVFGRRLPEVAGQAAAHLNRARRALTDLRRESGIDDELRKARRTLSSADLSMRRQTAPKPSWYPATDVDAASSPPPPGEEEGTPEVSGPTDPPPGSAGPSDAPQDPQFRQGDDQDDDRVSR